ncbi:hypothetical protein H310_14221 [Aphanomyces invadans]|uniref:Uncharacterized protein n=1 Tax=Aphanomyces invadans TaxID=157072 RepID=A0A024TCP7_9STRA|nr:hypothetical protein H310_14221 [Aphanomyces invadans]ETV91127.1 hypothetical protein H310_14221 [Aphanomyces invadans]|eukprot:XP_008880254.1 hypothetical protein H310_14221 [Aphanomyces invadans]
MSSIWLQRMAASKAICKAASDGNMTELRKILLDVDVNVASEPDSKYCGKSALHLACESGKLNVARFLLSQPTLNVNVCTPYGETPLFFACQHGHVEIVQLLLARPEANVNASNGNQWTALHSACENGFTDVVRLLFTRPELAVAEFSWRRTPMHLACQQGHLDIVRLLLAHPHVSCHIDSMNVSNATPVHLAAKRQHTPVVEALVLHALQSWSSPSASSLEFWATFLDPAFPLAPIARAHAIQAAWAATSNANTQSSFRQRLAEHFPAENHPVLSLVVW